MPVLSKHPDWPYHFLGETVILKCTIQDRHASDWKYTWLKDNIIKKYRQLDEYVINPSENNPSGEYKCEGQGQGGKHDQQFSKYSDPITMTFKGMDTLYSFADSILCFLHTASIPPPC